MDYKEKWITLKEEIEQVVNCGLQCVGQMGIENQSRLVAYILILYSMYELDSKEKVDEILDDFLYELLVELSKKQTLERD